MAEMEFQSLNPIFPAKNLDETRTFYESIGFRTLGVFPEYGYLIMGRDGSEIHFWHAPDLDPATSNHAGYLRLPDVDPLFRHLESLDLPTEGIPRVDFR